MSQRINASHFMLMLVLMTAAGVEVTLWRRMVGRQEAFADIEGQNPSLILGAVDGAVGTDVGHESAEFEKAVYDSRSRQISRFRLPLWATAAMLLAVMAMRLHANRHKNG